MLKGRHSIPLAGEHALSAHIHGAAGRRGTIRLAALACLGLAAALIGQPVAMGAEVCTAVDGDTIQCGAERVRKTP